MLLVKQIVTWDLFNGFYLIWQITNYATGNSLKCLLICEMCVYDFKSKGKSER